MSFAIPQPRELGLSKKEKQNYSLLNALGHIQKGNWNELGLEREASDAIANRRNLLYFLSYYSKVGWLKRRTQ